MQQLACTRRIGVRRQERRQGRRTEGKRRRRRRAIGATKTARAGRGRQQRPSAETRHLGRSARRAGFNDGTRRKDARGGGRRVSEAQEDSTPRLADQVHLAGTARQRGHTEELAPRQGGAETHQARRGARHDRLGKPAIQTNSCWLAPHRSTRASPPTASRRAGANAARAESTCGRRGSSRQR